jgi:hypothetical protein
VTLLKSIGGTHEVNVHNAQENVVRLVADLSSAIGDEVALPQMAQAELEKSNVFMRGTATDARSRRVVPLKFHCSRYDLLRVSRPRAFRAAAASRSDADLPFSGATSTRDTRPWRPPIRAVL